MTSQKEPRKIKMERNPYIETQDKKETKAKREIPMKTMTNSIPSQASSSASDVVNTNEGEAEDKEQRASLDRSYPSSSARSQKTLKYVCSSSLGGSNDVCGQIEEGWR